MAPPRHPPPPTEQQQAAAAAAAAAAVRLPDFHADSPQSWFTNLDSQFATANITQSLTKFHWAVAKLPFSLNPTIQPLADDPTAVAVPFTTSRCASATGWKRCQPSDSNHAPILQRRPRCPEFGAARPPLYASGTSRRREPWQPAGYTSPPNCQPNRDGNRFPLARRQGFLHAPPLFSTAPPLGPPATAERRQD
jgi:hypothetical protein